MKKAKQKVQNQKQHIIEKEIEENKRLQAQAQIPDEQNQLISTQNQFR